MPIVNGHAFTFLVAGPRPLSSVLFPPCLEWVSQERMDAAWRAHPIATASSGGTSALPGFAFGNNFVRIRLDAEGISHTFPAIRTTSKSTPSSPVKVSSNVSALRSIPLINMSNRGRLMGTFISIPSNKPSTATATVGARDNVRTADSHAISRRWQAFLDSSTPDTLLLRSNRDAQCFARAEMMAVPEQDVSVTCLTMVNREELEDFRHMCVAVSPDAPQPMTSACFQVEDVPVLGAARSTTPGCSISVRP
mmetsp:Transcript_2557/g.5472  ORF Transcript_2557/g.5472 Transcript_2557/m.5472 type:complete len:251 (-) Transcript_2557:671-1423(-)